MKLKKGDLVRLRGGKTEDATGEVVYRGATSIFVNFNGFETLVNLNRLERVKK